MSVSIRTGIVLIAVFTVLLTVLGVVGIFYGEQLFTSMLQKKLAITPGSFTFHYFQNPPVEILIAFRFFNVTNPDSVVYNGSKPNVVEIGPYYYKHRHGKDNITFNEDETEIFFEQRKYYEFDASRTEGSEDDTFVNMDLIGYSVAKATYDLGAIRFIAKTLASTNRNYPFTSYRIKDFLFGAEDLLLKKVIPLKFPDPANRPPPRFGIFMDLKTGESMHGKFDYNFTINTGKKDLSKFQSLVNFAGMDRLSIWPNNTNLSFDPNELRGSIGTGFIPGVKKDSVLSIFTEDLCLSFDISYVKALKFGQMEAYRFGVDAQKWRLLSGTLNRAFCSPDDLEDPVKCMQYGVFNTSTCRGKEGGATLPHMLFADEFYRNTVVGLKPDPKRHNVFIDVDPLTGIPLNGAKRAQVNFQMKRFNYKLYRNIPEYTMMPVMWFEEIIMANSAASKHLLELHNLKTMLRVVSYSILIFGLVLMIFMIAGYFAIKRRSGHNGKRKTFAINGHVKTGNGTKDEKNLLS